jgi:formylmethanofuran dehydrogenase subunit B
MWKTDLADNSGTLTCPFCGLGCDDLRVEPRPAGQLGLSNGCTTAQAAFGGALAQPSATAAIGGVPASTEAALERAADLLAAARAPLFSGLATDVNGMRALLALADCCGAPLDHAGGDALFRNLLTLQDGGWMTATLTEVRNRADLVVLVGSQALQRFPRLLERVLLPPDALFSPPAERRFFLLGPWEPDDIPPEIPSANRTVLPIDRDALFGALGLLRGLIAGRPVRADALPGVPAEPLLALAEAVRAARYSVFCWSAAELDFPHAELTVQSVVELVRDLNATGRAAALPLAGTLADVTANQVCTWQTGYPLRSGNRHGRLDYQPALYRYRDVLARGECDLLLWVQALPSAAPPPASDCPRIVLGHPGIPLDPSPQVYLPVGLPGIDHPGHWYRTDSVCPLPLGQVRNVGLPSVAQTVGQLAGLLGARRDS